MTRDAGNMFQYFAIRTENAPLPRRRWVGHCNIQRVSSLSPVRVGEGGSQTVLGQFYLSSYGTWWKPLKSHIARLWTLSRCLMLAVRFGGLASTAYSRFGRVMAHYSAIKAGLDSLENERRTRWWLARSPFGWGLSQWVEHLFYEVDWVPPILENFAGVYFFRLSCLPSFRLCTVICV